MRRKEDFLTSKSVNPLMPHGPVRQMCKQAIKEAQKLLCMYCIVLLYSRDRLQIGENGTHRYRWALLLQKVTVTLFPVTDQIKIVTVRSLALSICPKYTISI
jgi:hypothetical protein